MHPHKYSYKYFTWMHFNKMCVCVGACAFVSNCRFCTFFDFFGLTHVDSRAKTAKSLAPE